MSNKFIETGIFSSRENDPYCVREIFFLIFSLFISLDYVNMERSIKFTGNPFYFISSYGIFFIIIYSAVISSIFARRIYNGQIGMLFISNFPRKFYLIFTVLFSSLSFSFLLLLPIIFLQGIIYNTFYIKILVLLFILMFSTSFLYISIGFVISAVLRSELLTLIVIIFPFTLAQIYVFQYFPKSSLMQFLLSGFGQVSRFTSETGFYIVGISVYLIISILLTLSLYKITIATGLKSGRS
jgi:hypothetical protein